VKPQRYLSLERVVWRSVGEAVNRPRFDVAAGPQFAAQSDATGRLATPCNSSCAGEEPDEPGELCGDLQQRPALGVTGCYKGHSDLVSTRVYRLKPGRAAESTIVERCAEAGRHALTESTRARNP
jgi:hypothetical protein